MSAEVLVGPITVDTRASLQTAIAASSKGITATVLNGFSEAILAA
jgi:hypothetical protein